MKKEKLQMVNVSELFSSFQSKLMEVFAQIDSMRATTDAGHFRIQIFEGNATKKEDILVFDQEIFLNDERNDLVMITTKCMVGDEDLSILYDTITTTIWKERMQHVKEIRK